MALTELARAVDDLIIDVVVEPLCHFEIVLPCCKHLAGAHLIPLHLPAHIIVDLRIAHSPDNKPETVGGQMLHAHPLDHLVGDGLIAHLFIAQPYDELISAVALAKPFQPVCVEAEHLRERRGLNTEK